MGTAETIYLLCAATSLVAAFMLLRYYLRRRTPLLLWSFIGFLGLAVSNVLVFVDIVIYPSIDMSLARAAVSAFAMLALVYGLIWEAEGRSGSSLSCRRCPRRPRESAQLFSCATGANAAIRCSCSSRLR